MDDVGIKVWWRKMEKKIKIFQGGGERNAEIANAERTRWVAEREVNALASEQKPNGG